VQTPLTSRGVQEIIDVASEQLRLLAHVVELARDDQTALPIVDSMAQDSFIDALASKIRAFETLLAQPAPTSDVPSAQATQGAVLMARLLQFNMAFRGVWTPKARSLGESLCKSIFDLALVSFYHVARRYHALTTMIRHTALAIISTPQRSHCFLIPSCISLTVSFVFRSDIKVLNNPPVTELTTDAKSNSADIFRNYPQIPLAELPADMPAEYRQQLRCLLPYPPPHDVVADLVYSSIDASGQIHPGPPVMNQPWDWVESLGDNASSDAPTDRTILNNTSISLERFAARATGDIVRSEKTARGFHDALGGESVFSRDWAETRIPLADENPARREDDDVPPTGVLPGAFAARRGMSPASPAWSRQSATSSRLQSPTQQSYTRASAASRSDGQPDLERSSAGSRHPGAGSKRKASTISPDSEIEVIESPSALKKSKTTKATKTTKTALVKPRAKRK